MKGMRVVIKDDLIVLASGSKVNIASHELTHESSEKTGSSMVFKTDFTFFMAFLG
jgi:hypothetical protein